MKKRKAAMGLAKTALEVGAIGLAGALTGAGLETLALAGATEKASDQVGFWGWVAGSMCPNGWLSTESQAGLLADDVPKEWISNAYKLGGSMVAAGLTGGAYASARLMKRVYDLYRNQR